MSNLYKIKFISQPPRFDIPPANYAVEIESKQPIDANDIRHATNHASKLEKPEQIADALAKALPGRQVITSWHAGVQIITTRGTA